MGSDLFSVLAEGQARVGLSAKRTLADHTGMLLLGACLLLTAALPLVFLEVINPFSPAFFMRTAYTGLSSYLSYLLFLPEGKRSAILREASYTAASERLAALSERVREGRLARFAAYCQRTALREAERRRAELLAISEADGYPKGRRRRARRLAGRVRVRPISPARVLCGGEAGEVSDVGRRHLSYGARSARARPFLILGSALLFSSVNILPGAAPDAATAVRILVGMFGVTMAAFAGYTAGVGQIRYETALAERRILFLSSFLEAEREEPSTAM